MAATRTVIHRRGNLGHILAPLAVHPRGVLNGIQRVWAARQALPWLAMVGVPLALTASLEADQWWSIVPLALCAWWWAPRTWGWEWFAAMQAGLVGAAWATVGAGMLAIAPEHRVAIAAAWAATAAALAGVAGVARRRAGGR